MAELEDTHNKSLMKFLQKENEHLKNLLEQVYEMSALDDMITDGCLDRKDDEFLMCNLSLKSQIMEALGKSLGERKLAKELKPLMTEASLKLTKHNGSKVLADHYEEKKS